MTDGINVPEKYMPPTSAEEILRRYQSGERFFQNIDLPDGASLRGACLAGSDFTNSFLSVIDFRDADLRGVCFDGCNVKVSDFKGADLRGASFRRSLLCGAMLAGANVEGVIVDGASWYGFKVKDIRDLLAV